MSNENEVVRQPIALAARSRRGLDERIYVRFPAVGALLGRAVFKLRPHSRLRQALVRRAVQSAAEAHNRGDLKAAFALFHVHCESTFPPQMGGLGSASDTHGRGERIAFHRRFLTEWGELRFEPEEVIDRGDGHVLVVGRMKGRGLSSGAAFDNEWANLVKFSDGQVIREQTFLDHREAFESTGLRQ